MKKITILILLIIGIVVSCKSVEPVSEIEIPTFNEVRPERPVLKATDTPETSLYIVAGYAEKLEVYSTALESYVEEIKILF